MQYATMRTSRQAQRNDALCAVLECGVDEDVGVRSSAVRAGALALTVLPATACAAWGDSTSPEDDISRLPVRERPRPDYEPIGYRIGPHFFSPRLTTSGFYNSNVFARPTNRQSDFGVVFSPQLLVQGDTSRFSYALDLGLDIYRFRKLSREDRENAHARYRGRSEITRDLVLDTSAEIARKHEIRGDSSSPLDAARPVPYTDMRAEASLTRTFNHFAVAVGTNVRRLEFENVESVNGGTLDLGWRDGTIVTGWVKPSYEFWPGYRAFIRGRVNNRDYAGEGDLNRDSQGYDLRGGLDFQLTPLIWATVEVGHMNQSYANALIPAISGPSFLGKAQWLVTPLVTLSASAERTLAETTSPEFDGRVDTAFLGRADYELLRNVILFAETKYAHEDFRGSPRKDDVTKLSTGADYLMNRFARLGLRYDYIERASNIPTFSFDQHVVTFNASARF